MIPKAVQQNILGMISKDPNHLPDIGHGTPSSARYANVPDELARFGRDRVFTVSDLCRQNSADISSYSWTCIVQYEPKSALHWWGIMEEQHIQNRKVV